MENLEKDEEHKTGDAIRRLAQAKSVTYLAAGAVSFGTLTILLSQGIDGKTMDLLRPPAQALSLLSTGTTAASGVFHQVAGTTFDRTYEARFARLAPEVEQGGGNNPVGFQSVLRST